MKGKVSLVGAGPGDPGLLTLKALRLLQDADVVIYDFLANPDHLKHSRPEALKICVGKRFRHQLYTQAKINRLIIREAAKGSRVVRLKGGDPYLFGRGGEEALFLVKNRIPFEVVPGVTSATACAAYAGIPLTHRDHNASVTFLTGHRAHDKNLDSIDWKKIVSVGGTLVIYMGFYNLAIIARRLRLEGMPSRTPVAVIEWGTLPKQLSCLSNLSRIAGDVKKGGLKAPCIIIVGEVASLGRQLNWYEKLPLFGQSVVVTRNREKAGTLGDRLRDLGADVIELPLIRIEPPAAFLGLDSALRNIRSFDWLVFTSAAGVESFFDRLRWQSLDARSLGGVRIASVGPETSAALSRAGLRADLEPLRYESAAIVEEFKRLFGSLQGDRIAVFQASGAPDTLNAGLVSLGADVTRIDAYRTVPAEAPSPPIKKRISSGRVDWVTFTSGSTAENFVKCFGRSVSGRISRRVKFASIGPVTSETMKRLGLRVAVQAKNHDLNGLIEAITRKGL